MWKFISLSVILIVAQATDIKELYGSDWVLAAIYPVPRFSIPIHCTRYRFSKNPENVQCTLSDGSSAFSVQAEMMNATGSLLDTSTTAMMVVKHFSQVTPALNLTSDCGGEEQPAYSVVRFVDEDYLIIYQNLDSSNGVDQNQAGLFARDIMSQKKINKVMSTIEELKQRRGVVTCTTEIYDGLNSKDGFNSNENEIDY
ncbi:uncharacterized protein LOC124636331 [Helicoverpa zea]|uniref:uncharacterized protein LOC124636331 n=1 Tax=Helicoverpa zea TaxID=7113 RepID=UPI001F5ACEC5|nr:uncharacterized protein LOC124636331 [Helicoverpa zea]